MDHCINMVYMVLYGGSWMVVLLAGGKLV